MPWFGRCEVSVIIVLPSGRRFLWIRRGDNMYSRKTIDFYKGFLSAFRR